MAWIREMSISEFNDLKFVSTKKEVYDAIKKMYERYLAMPPISNSKS